MSRFLAKKICIPPMLWKLHGRSAFLGDLLITYLFAVLVGLVNLYFSSDLELWAKIIILVLSLDIGGGVVSNMTRGTIAYYRHAKLSPYKFIWFHLMQAAALAWVYTGWMDQIMILSLVIMVFSSELVVASGTFIHKPFSAFAFGLILLAVLILEGPVIPVRLLVLLLAFKLIIGFGGQYKVIPKY